MYPLNDGTKFKTAYGDGATYAFFESLVFIAYLASLIPQSRVNLAWFHRIKHRTLATSGKRGKGRKPYGTEAREIVNRVC